MIRFPNFLAVLVAFATPATALAQPLDCPDASLVFSKDNGAAKAVSLDQLAEQIGGVEMNGGALNPVVDHIRRDFPAAGDAEIADLMITAYCSYLSKDGRESHRTEANVKAFEKQIYQVVFSGPTPPDYKKKGWLNGN